MAHVSGIPHIAFRRVPRNDRSYRSTLPAFEAHRTMLLCLSIARMMFSYSICGSSGNGVLGCCVRTRQGGATPGVEGEVGLRARFRCCRRPFPASPLPHPACPFQGTGRSTCLSRRSAAAGGGCWFRGGGRDVAAAVAIARYGDAGGAGEHDLPLSEPPAFTAEAAFHL